MYRLFFNMIIVLACIALLYYGVLISWMNIKKLFEATPYLRRYFTPRQPSEKLKVFLIRIHRELVADTRWAFHKLMIMYGGSRRTMEIHLKNVIILAVFALLGKVTPIELKWWLIYPGVGFGVIAPQVTRPEDRFPELNLLEMLWLWLYYSWSWPVYVWRMLTKRRK